jgi:hypothetical protein
MIKKFQDVIIPCKLYIKAATTYIQVLKRMKFDIKASTLQQIHSIF